MKYVIVLGDGMADYPLKQLNGSTPLQTAVKPNMDLVAKEGCTGLLKTIPEGMAKGSDVANMSVLGYDPKKYLTGGRGPIEAASMGVKLGKDDIAFRCNLITEEDGVLKDYSGGKPGNEEAAVLIDTLNRKLGTENIIFYPGVSYRHLLVVKNAPPGETECKAPHDNMGKEISGLMSKGTLAEKLNKLMLRSKDVLKGSKANMIWLWGPGRRLEMPSMKEKYGVEGVVISAVDLIKGIGVYAGLEALNVPGATGYFDTDYKAKAKAALNALKTKDFAYVHIEAPDEAGHEGSVEEKIKAIENIDKHIVGKLLDEDIVLAVLPDHPTPIDIRTHVGDPVPFAIRGQKKDSVEKLDEESVRQGGYGLVEGKGITDLML